MRWSEFSVSCPELAELAETRFAKDEVVMIGTLRSDGSARLSPAEPSDGLAKERRKQS